MLKNKYLCMRVKQFHSAYLLQIHLIFIQLNESATYTNECMCTANKSDNQKLTKENTKYNIMHFCILPIICKAVC